MVKCRQMELNTAGVSREGGCICLAVIKSALMKWQPIRPAHCHDEIDIHELSNQVLMS